MNRLINILKHRMKILFKSKTIIILSLIMISLFTMLINTLYESAKESSKVPVAVVDKDLTDLSKSIIDNLKRDTILSIIDVDEKNAFTKLKEGKLEAVYILNKGLKESIVNENYNEIIDVFYIKGSTIAKFIGDIFAEKVLRDLCLTKSLNLLERAIDKNEIENKADILMNARSYAHSIGDYGQHQYYVKVDFVNSNNKSIDVSDLDNSLIYKQMILGIIISFISFFLLFASIGTVKDKETRMFSRIQVSSTKSIIIILGNYLSLVISGGILSIIFSILNSIHADSSNMLIFIHTFLVLIFYVISISSLIILFTSLIDKVSTHIMIFTILILIMGIVSGSFFSIDLLAGSAKSLSYLIPNYWTLKALLDIITLGNDYGNLFNFIGIMLTYSCVMIVLTYIINQYRQKVVK